MDYSKSGGAIPSKKAPRHKEHNEPGSDKKPFGAKEDKAALLARQNSRSSWAKHSRAPATFWLKPAPRCRHRLRKPLKHCASRWVNFLPALPTG